ncbi:pyrimidodiazepine synthase-like [Copidosoma floridanum]|uniref:pyrimidodiazepine synthase-like n=1 Tax=Copidosoma floridanum TaxID=29053 RepID=UPI0006C99A48|nr:pyrimidodiazepine synthase-like [Copidosoma floridanum]XP_014210878.1 pyrimidodiazepine synthase-like [Copidosoma floridanum]XP_014210879.1 pyrimidodiazepine synthase-like [Copidosoma floridanum]
MMSSHLGAGSEQPPRVEGKVRLYRMKYCPFAQRVSLALTFKKIPHDIVNINLRDKPEWYMQINPEGKVPALVDLNGEIVVDSTAIVNYLEEKYPEPALCKKETIKRDLELLEHYGKILKVFFDCVHRKDTRPLKTAVDEMCTYLVEFEEELKKLNTPFFTGDNPGMVDILMWPFVEKAKCLALIYKEPMDFEKEKFPLILKWVSKMKEQEFVQQNAISYETFAKVAEASNAGNVNYDAI